MTFSKTPPTEPGWYQQGYELSGKIEWACIFVDWVGYEGHKALHIFFLDASTSRSPRMIELSAAGDCFWCRVPAPGTTWNVEEIGAWVFNQPGDTPEQICRYVDDQYAGIAATTERNKKEGV